MTRPSNICPQITYMRQSFPTSSTHSYFPVQNTTIIVNFPNQLSQEGSNVATSD